MDIASLRAFVAVAETGSFSRAAERLFITQPAISKRVAALEDGLQVHLFDRLGRKVVTTEAGIQLLGNARRILNDLDTSMEAVRTLGHDANDHVSGKLKIGTSHHVGIHRLPPVLRQFTETHPHVDLDLLFMDSEQACELVAEGSLEVAIVTLPETPTPSLITDMIWHDPLAIVCGPSHPLVETKTVSATTLSKYPAILPGVGTITRRILFDALAPLNVDVQTRLETNYLETIKMLVSVGLGWSTLPESMIDNAIKPVRVRGLKMERQLGSVRLKGRTLSRAAQALLGLC